MGQAEAGVGIDAVTRYTIASEDMKSAQRGVAECGSSAVIAREERP